MSKTELALKAGRSRHPYLRAVAAYLTSGNVPESIYGKRIPVDLRPQQLELISKIKEVSNLERDANVPTIGH